MALYYQVKAIVRIPDKEESGMDSGCDLDFVLNSKVSNYNCKMVGETHYQPSTEEEFNGASSN